jgi:hypothetical protein
MCALLVAGCSTHPLPEDVTRETTYYIVQKIRCEAREALDNISVRLLRTSTYGPTLDLADRVEAGEVEMVDVFKRNSRYRHMVDPRVIPMLQAYTLSAVTFDFSFAIAETNDNSASANFRMPLINGLFTLGSTAGVKFERKTLRKFQVTNSFFELHTLPRLDCRAIAAPIANMIYPITGKIGVEEVFQTFVNIDSGAGLVTDSTHKFSDTLTFTTSLIASATPKIALDPIANRRFRLADASAALIAARSDEHQVTIALAKGKLVTSLEQARRGAKVQSKIIADEVRVEDFFLIQRQNSRRLNELLLQP